MSAIETGRRTEQITNPIKTIISLKEWQTVVDAWDEARFSACMTNMFLKSPLIKDNSNHELAFSMIIRSQKALNTASCILGQVGLGEYLSLERGEDRETIDLMVKDGINEDLKLEPIVLDNHRWEQPILWGFQFSFTKKPLDQI